MMCQKPASDLHENSGACYLSEVSEVPAASVISIYSFQSRRKAATPCTLLSLRTKAPLDSAVSKHHHLPLRLYLWPHGELLLFPFLFLFLSFFPRPLPRRELQAGVGGWGKGAEGKRIRSRLHAQRGARCGLNPTTQVPHGEFLVTNFIRKKNFKAGLYRKRDLQPVRTTQL